MSDPRLGTAFAPTDRVGALAWAASQDALVVSVPAEHRATAPVHVRLTGDGRPAYGHVRIEAGRFSEAVVVLEHLGDARYAANVEIDVADGARLTVVSLQSWASDAVHLSRQHASLGRDANFRSVVVTLGGAVVRLLPTVDYRGPCGDAEFLGVFFADSGQHLEHRVFVHHAEPHCRSYVSYKGALQGEGTHTVWVGDVLVRPTAVGVDTYETNRNLLLSDGARADSVPNLELETGELIGAGHASATGRFDDDQLFYLQSRGIPASVARALVIRGFFAEVVDRIGDAAIAAAVMAAVDDRLRSSGLSVTDSAEIDVDAGADE
jgi:Fe-S cluster assembly protein SufD